MTHVDLTEFNLTNIDFRKINFANCTMPVLTECRLDYLPFDLRTSLRKRQSGGIADVTGEGLQVHDMLPTESTVEGCSAETHVDVADSNDFIATARRRRICSYRIDEIFTSNDPDFATEKRHYLKNYKDMVIKPFKQIALHGFHVNLAHVDLRDLDLSGMDLAHADLFGANLSRANLQNTDLNCADLRRAILWETNLRDATITEANMAHARIKIFIFNSQLSKIVGTICEQFDRSKISSERINSRELVVFGVDS